MIASGSAVTVDTMITERDVALLGRDCLEGVTALRRNVPAALGCVDALPPLSRSLADCLGAHTGALREALHVIPGLLRDAWIEPDALDEREAARVAGELCPLISAALFDDLLRPAGLVEWSPRSAKQWVWGWGMLLELDAARLLAGQRAVRSLWVVEGVAAYLTAATQWSDAAENAGAVLGIVGGHWRAEFAERVPDGTTVYLACGAANDARVVASLAQRAGSGRVMLRRQARRTA
jgi:hypothetical protein